MIQKNTAPNFQVYPIHADKSAETLISKKMSAITRAGPTRLALHQWSASGGMKALHGDMRRSWNIGIPKLQYIDISNQCCTLILYITLIFANTEETKLTLIYTNHFKIFTMRILIFVFTVTNNRLFMSRKTSP